VRIVLLRVAEIVLVLGVLGAAVGIALQHWQPIRVAGGSMRPALFPGDMVVVNVDSRVSRGEIALLRSPRHGLVLHRVIAVQDDGSVRTQGDANPIADFDSLAASAVVGPVVIVAPVGRLIQRWRGSAACATMTAQ
jgi:signal peptidase I